MNAKWYFSTLIIALTLLGVCQKQDSVANQEIVIEFVNVEATKEDFQNAITNIKAQLLDVGVANIKVQEAEDGTLKITYHSDINVANIKEILSKDNHLVLGYASSNPSNDSHSSDDTSDYNLDVYEIKQGTESSSLGGGKYVLEVKYDYDRFTNPNVYFPQGGEPVCKLDHAIKTAYKVNKNIAVAIDNTSHKEPEVRAGPIC
jgi:preprotein translocase subunit SecD